MATIERFEDIEAWRDTRALVKRVYELTGDGVFARDFVLRDQIRRAAMSIMSNVAEGLERGSPKDFVRFLYMAKGSAGEVRSQLYAAADLRYVSEERSMELRTIVESISRRIAAFIRYLTPDA
ncbi:MAG: four helix bundle protein [Phycisphaerales bacterium]|nr:MAG: four helix bundle protein [Phycisphaerales bacterium]